ncbi:uncharacterized protein LOC105429672 [Pogonomyrmex barbatus]|uniref:Uncharacterized protein LOC105429672 n=1 Tax=Pogonomyrmex barbatus TaxID=144034 RepID=A0A8N1S9M6_9HYME|nr:uncharacterized protein LOC105429672 [Pogonomyrmex barbatus]
MYIQTIVISDEFLKYNLNVIDDSDTDEEIDTIFLTRYRHRLRGTRKKPLRIINYVDRTVPGLTVKQFREHFRMIPDIYEILEGKLNFLLNHKNHLGRPIILVRKQSALWLLATPNSYRSVDERFDIGKSSASDSFMRVVEALMILLLTSLSGPETGVLLFKRSFSIGKLPYVIRAINGTNILIKAPKAF